MNKIDNKSNGFTFIEVMIVIGVVALMAGLSIPIYQSFLVSSVLEDTTREVVQTLRSAQSKAMASEQLSDFGVHLEANKFVLFRGNIYNPADPENEEVILPTILTMIPSFGSEVVYTSISGETLDIGSISINTSQGNTRTITINSLGVVNVL